MQRLKSLRDRRAVRRATLPWAELEAEATRQGCSPADIFFDRAGRQPSAAPNDKPPAGTPARAKRHDQTLRCQRSAANTRALASVRRKKRASGHLR
jgi:hypothetical protein